MKISAGRRRLRGIINDTGLICIAAFVAPHEAVREKARAVIGSERFVSVHLTAPAEVLRQRDERGMYKLAESGKLKSFPGVSAAYESPTKADLTLETDKLSVEACVEKVVGLLRNRGYLGVTASSPRRNMVNLSGYNATASWALAKGNA